MTNASTHGTAASAAAADGCVASLKKSSVFGAFRREGIGELLPTLSIRSWLPRMALKFLGSWPDSASERK